VRFQTQRTLVVSNALKSWLMKSARSTSANPIGRDLLIITIGTFLVAVVLVTLTVLVLHQL
jgi:hypothetical protein